MNLHITKSKHAESFYICKSYVKANGSTTSTIVRKLGTLEQLLSLDIPNAQIATFIPDWNKVNLALASGEMDKEEYDMWLEDTLKLFNVPIDEYI